MRLVRHHHATSILAVFALLGFVAHLLAQDVPGPGNAPASEGRRIVDIFFEPSRQPLEIPKLFEILPVQRNQLYKASEIRAAIERLYATGRYQDIQVDASPS